MIVELTGTRQVAAERRCDHCSGELPQMVLRAAETGKEECYHWKCAFEAHPEMAEELKCIRQAGEVQP